MKPFLRLSLSALLLATTLAAPTRAATITIDTSPTGRLQTIDGFGTCMWNKWAEEPWYQELYYDDLGASMMRMDLTPYFKSPYSDDRYNSPAISSKDGSEKLDPATEGGPDHNRARTYTGPKDYSRDFGGKKAPIAVMTPDINKNIQFFDYSNMEASGQMAHAGLTRKQQLGDFKLYGSIWSPAPWVKMVSGGYWNEKSNRYPAKGTPYPFIWNGDFGGGRLDVSDTPLDVFNDGTGPTSALTQFARCTAAYIKGFQDKFGVKLYAMSIQNEVNFEEFYKSATYPRSSQYIAALKAVRNELDKYPDLKDIQIAGPEDLIGGNASGMWQYEGNYPGNPNVCDKNLQYLQNIQADPEADKALGLFCIHGYTSDGATAAGADSQLWDWWVHGWNKSPAPGLPANVKGFADYHKKSWMTETSGEADQWLAPAKGFPKNGGWSIALKMQQALTAGRESALIYWQFAEPSGDGDHEGTTTSCLTGKKNRDQDPKYVAAKHFAKFIRPNAVAVKATVTDDPGLTASAYIHDQNHTLTLVLVTKTDNPTTAKITLPADFGGIKEFQAVTSSDGALWQPSKITVTAGQAEITVPAFGIVTLQGKW